MKSLIFVSSNDHKYNEFRDGFKTHNISIIHMKREYPEIQGRNHNEVIINSIGGLISVIEPPFFVEDSGIEVQYLENFPSIYSSYVFKTIGLKGILNLLKDVENRSATFKSIVGYVDENYTIKIFEGKTEGEITLSPRGTGGFGYDPIFVPKDSTHTYAEMTIEQKNRISHRAKSIKQFLSYLTGTE